MQQLAQTALAKSSLVGTNNKVTFILRTAAALKLAALVLREHLRPMAPYLLLANAQAQPPWLLSVPKRLPTS